MSQFMGDNLASLSKIFGIQHFQVVASAFAIKLVFRIAVGDVNVGGQATVG